MTESVETRLARLERVLEARQPMHVLVAQDGEEAAAVARYEASTPERERAHLVVVVRRFTGGAVISP
jgi:hypothetical protein